MDQENDERYGVLIAAAAASAEKERRNCLAPALAAERAWELARHTSEQALLLLRNSTAYGRVEVVRALVHLAFSLRATNPPEMLRLLRAATRAARALHRLGGKRALWADVVAEAEAYLANALRVRGAFRSAELHFARARRSLAAGTGDLLLEARVYDLEASMRADQKRLAEACALYREASRLYAEAGDSHLVARTQINLGRAEGYAKNFPAAISGLYFGLMGADLAREPGLGLTGAHNLILFLAEAGHPTVAAHLLKILRPLHDLRPLDNEILRLRWMEGRLLAALLRAEEARELLDGVRKGFVALDFAYDAALAALDVAGVELQLGNRSRVRQLALEMVPVFQSREIHREARAALALFVKATEAEQLTVEAVQTLWRWVDRVRSRGQAL